MAAVTFPAESHTLRAAGWEYDSDAPCRICREWCEWWISPKGKKVLLSRIKLDNPLKRNIEALDIHRQRCE